MIIKRKLIYAETCGFETAGNVSDLIKSLEEMLHDLRKKGYLDIRYFLDAGANNISFDAEAFREETKEEEAARLAKEKASEDKRRQDTIKNLKNQAKKLGLKPEELL